MLVGVVFCSCAFCTRPALSVAVGSGVGGWCVFAPTGLDVWGGMARDRRAMKKVACLPGCRCFDRVA